MMNFNSDPAVAEKELQRAIELNPNYPTAHHWYALLLANLGRIDEAKREIRRAQQLDPLSLIINRTVGNVFFWARDYDQALEQFKKGCTVPTSISKSVQPGTAFAVTRALPSCCAAPDCRSDINDPGRIACLRNGEH